METVKISKTLMTRLKEKQKKHEQNSEEIWMELLGCNAQGVVTKGVVLWDGRPNKGCGYFPAMSVDDLTEPTVELIKAGFTPYGLLRIHKYTPENSSINLLLNPIGFDTVRLCAPGKLKMFTLGLNDLFEISQYTSTSGGSTQNFEYKIVEDSSESELDKS